MVRAEDVPATAPAPTWAVQVSPDSRCAKDPDFVAALTEQIPALQRTSVDAAELVAQVVVKRTSNSLDASIRVFDRVLQSEAGAREISLPIESCGATADAISLVLGVLVEAGRAAPQPAPSDPAPPPPLPPPPPPQPPREDEDPPAPPPVVRPPAQRYAWLGPRAGHDLGLSAGGGWGLLPGFYAGGSLSWTIRPANLWPVRLEGTGWLPRANSADLGRFGAAYGSVFVCPLTGERGRLRGQACPGVSAGAMWARGNGLFVERKRTEPIALAGLEINGDWRIAGPLSLSLSGRVEAPLVRYRFFYYRAGGGEPLLHQPKPVMFTLFGGLSLRFR